MKTSIKTLFATGLIALAITTSSVYAKTVKENYVSASAVNISAIKKLIVNGNVEVTVVQNSKSKVLYSNEGTGRVAVKKVGTSLYISSANNVKDAKIIVYVDDIYRIDASENALILTDKALNLKYLQVFLTDNANVVLNSTTEDLFTSIKNASKLVLNGSSKLYAVDMDKSSRIGIEKFKTEETKIASESAYVSSRG